MKEFIYRLTLVDRLFVEENWTDEDESHVGKHFKYLQDLQKQGILILAGKTAGLDTNTIGIVLFQASSFADAEQIMKNDPAITNGIMTGFLQEYNIALYNNAYKKE